jgi:hypothetical protein
MNPTTTFEVSMVFPHVPSPRRTGDRVLYLDFDGVLHPEDVRRDRKRRPYVASPPGHTLFEHADLVADLLRPYPEVRIVLSTSWVRVYDSVSRATKCLPPELRLRVIGATYHRQMSVDGFLQMSRGMQVWADVQRRSPDAWLAIDDDDSNWPTWCREQLVRTDEVLGLGSPPVLDAFTRKLAAMAHVDNSGQANSR